MGWPELAVNPYWGVSDDDPLTNDPLGGPQRASGAVEPVSDSWYDLL